MNVLLWVVQVLLALHTIAGAVWKFSNSELTVPSLSAIPHVVWLSLSGFEIVCAIGLIAPAFFMPMLVPVAALGIAAEMLAFVALHFVSGNPNHGQMIYWLVVSVVCAFVAYGRFAIEPL